MVKLQNYSEVIQVIFVSTTQYTFLITDIYARYIFDKYGIKPIVFYRIVQNFDISNFNTDGKYIIYPYSVKNCNIIGQCIFALQCGYLFHFTKWFKAVYKGKKTLLLAFNDKNKLVSRLFSEIKSNNSGNKITLIEEGTDTYSETLDIKKKGLYYLKHSISKLLFGIGRTSEVIGVNPLIDYSIVKNVERYKSLKKSNRQFVLQQDPNILLSAVDFIKHYEKSSSVKLECDVMYIGQPFYKSGKYFALENECIEKILEVIAYDYRILIKPHPRDDKDKYKKILKRINNISIIDESIAAFPIETLVGITSSKIVLTIQSSAAITLANMFPNMTVVVLRRISEARKLLAELDKLGEELPELTDDFFVSTNDNVYMPETIDEYVELIHKVVNKKTNISCSRSSKDIIFPEIDYLINEKMVQTR